MWTFKSLLYISLSRTLLLNELLVCGQVEVKVKANWRQDEGLLKRYGYGGQIQVH